MEPSRWFVPLCLQVVILSLFITTIVAQPKSCGWKCSEKGMIAVPRPYVPISNGCNGNDDKWMPDMLIAGGSNYTFEGCCKVHDICSQYCGISKTDCDDLFRDCMHDYCHEQEIGPEQHCRKISNLFYMGIAFFGCPLFKMYQSLACDCVETEVLADLVKKHTKQPEPKKLEVKPEKEKVFSKHSSQQTQMAQQKSGYHTPNVKHRTNPNVNNKLYSGVSNPYNFKKDSVL
eukprot:TRINITY_DN7088_c0_g1_i1.p1 TRINITY_DN7088_c0_g1~~TRINITY_DN7088_c0_g1_i1.p1  ORF type:complete len:231 (-),score=22.67 TRINITY_DN7088_c0_g1_i1:15-707(-)